MLNNAITFVNRERELAFLRQAFERKSAELLILYGRRRVGKTFLLQRFTEIAPIPVLYHVCVQTTAADELERLSKRLAEFLDDGVLALQPLRSWDAALAYLGQAARRKSFGLILDEFAYAVEGSTALPSLMQAAWDNDLRHTGLKIVLCGSSIGMMERIGLLPSSPLYGRRTGQWKLLPFGPEELSGLWPADSLAEILRVFGVVGGSPLYITRFDKGRTLEKNVLDHLLTKGAMLYEEVPFLLREELREPRVYQSILSSLAAGCRKFSELSSKTGLDKSHLTRYMATLIDLDLVERETPVTEPKPEKSRKGLYRIRDPFVSFWYRFVFPNRDALETGQAGRVLKDRVLPDLDAYQSLVLQPVIGALFQTRWCERLGFEPAFAGRHWSADEEFDWVVLDHDRRQAAVVEVKWSATPVYGAQLLADLERRSAQCAALKDCQRRHFVVSRSGFTARTKGNPAFIDLGHEKAGG